MPLITCPDCGKEISTSAVACPNCGRPLRRQLPPREGFLHNVGRFIFYFLVVLTIGSCGLYASMCGSRESTLKPNTPITTTPSSSATPQIRDTNNNAPRVRDPLNNEGNTSIANIMPPPLKTTPEDPRLEKIRQEAYKFGLQNGRNRPAYVTDDTEVKNTTQVKILAETAADVVYKPKPEHRQMWVGWFTRGFITGYNGRRPNAPIRTVTGEIATETQQ